MYSLSFTTQNDAINQLCYVTSMYINKIKFDTHLQYKTAHNLICLQRYKYKYFSSSLVHKIISKLLNIT